MPNNILIDSHTHAYPDEAVNDPATWADLHNENYWKSLVCTAPFHDTIQGMVRLKTFLRDMSNAGISKCILLGWYWENQSTCQLQNDFYAQWAQEYPEKFLFFATAQPKAGKQALDDVKRAVEAGAKGIGEIFPAAQGFSITDNNWLKIVEFAVEQHLPINMHVTEPIGPDYHGKTASALEDYYWLAKTYPELKLILAHWGGLIPFYELNPANKKVLKNVYYDTAASPLLYKKEIFKSVIDVVGPEKVLYGSDYPLRVYPRRQKEANFTDFLDEIKSTDLEPATLEKVLGGNLLRLLEQK